MPRIFDNIEQQLLSALQETLALSDRADFCIGYFNLRGWKQLDSYIEKWSGGKDNCCRLLVGMQRLPAEELRTAMSLIKQDAGIDNQTALRIKKKLAEEFREQLTIGIPTNEDEAGLRRLAAQIKAKKVVVKLFLRHTLHAKLYLFFRPDPINPTIGYLGSSNLTLAGLSHQGELNIDVLDHDACDKLSRWFEDRWGVTGDSSDPTDVAWRFSPVSNNKRELIRPEEELRVLISTDVLSEGQNLQDCSVVVNFDLPWAIIRLILRAGRVDRIGQQAENIICYSFLPADGVERIIRLRARVRRRLQENAEVVGTDEAFFEDDRNDRTVLDLYNEKSGILDGDADGEVDLASYAYQIWKNATSKDPELQKVVPSLPPVSYSTRNHVPSDREPEGVLVYMRTADDNDALAWIDKNGNSVTESQFAILRAAECSPETPAIPRDPRHHELVKRGVELIIEEEKSVGGQLGRPSGARFRTYERLKRYAEEVKGTLFESTELLKAIDDIYRYPIRPTAIDTLNRQLRGGIPDESLAQLVIALRDEGRLCIIHEEEQTQEPRIICSMGLLGD